MTEVLIASALAVLVVIGIERINTARFGAEEDIRRMMGSMVSEQQQLAALSMVHLAKHLERADRIYFINTGIATAQPFTGAVGSASIQLRIPECPVNPPTPACYDNPATYHWHQYARVGNSVVFYEDIPTVPGCPSPRVLSQQITSFTARFLDTAPAPPGGEPFPAPPSPNPTDNNVVEFSLMWNDGGIVPRTHLFQGQRVFRGVPYSDLAANCLGAGGPCDTGTGQSPAGISNPPVPPC